MSFINYKELLDYLLKSPSVSPEDKAELNKIIPQANGNIILSTENKKLLDKNLNKYAPTYYPVDITDDLLNGIKLFEMGKLISSAADAVVKEKMNTNDNSYETLVLKTYHEYLYYLNDLAILGREKIRINEILQHNDLNKELSNDNLNDIKYIQFTSEFFRNKLNSNNLTPFILQEQSLDQLLPLETIANNVLPTTFESNITNYKDLNSILYNDTIYTTSDISATSDINEKFTKILKSYDLTKSILKYLQNTKISDQERKALLRNLNVISDLNDISPMTIKNALNTIYFNQDFLTKISTSICDIFDKNEAIFLKKTEVIKPTLDLNQIQQNLQQTQEIQKKESNNNIQKPSISNKNLNNSTTQETDNKTIDNAFTPKINQSIMQKKDDIKFDNYIDIDLDESRLETKTNSVNTFNINKVDTVGNTSITINGQINKNTDSALIIEAKKGSETKTLFSEGSTNKEVSLNLQNDITIKIASANLPNSTTLINIKQNGLISKFVMSVQNGTPTLTPFDSYINNYNLSSSDNSNSLTNKENLTLNKNLNDNIQNDNFTKNESNNKLTNNTSNVNQNDDTNDPLLQDNQNFELSAITKAYYFNKMAIQAFDTYLAQSLITAKHEFSNTETPLDLINNINNYIKKDIKKESDISALERAILLYSKLKLLTEKLDTHDKENMLNLINDNLNDYKAKLSKAMDSIIDNPTEQNDDFSKKLAELTITKKPEKNPKIVRTDLSDALNKLNDKINNYEEFRTPEILDQAINEFLNKHQALSDDEKAKLLRQLQVVDSTEIVDFLNKTYNKEDVNKKSEPTILNTIDQSFLTEKGKVLINKENVTAQDYDTIIKTDGSEYINKDWSNKKFKDFFSTLSQHSKAKKWEEYWTKFKQSNTEISNIVNNYKNNNNNNHHHHSNKLR